jgi:hypothetical protein
VRPSRKAACDSDLADGFTARDIHQHGWSNLSDREHVQAGLDLLGDLDWDRGEDVPNGRAATRCLFRKPEGIGMSKYLARLNALIQENPYDLIERRLIEHGTEKIIPDIDDLAQGGRPCGRTARLTDFE